MFDWLGLSPELTRILGWIFVAVAVVLTAFLIYYSILVRKEIKQQKKSALKASETSSDSVETVSEIQTAPQIEIPLEIKEETKDNKTEVKDKKQKKASKPKTKTPEAQTPVLEHIMPEKISQHIMKEKLKRKSKTNSNKIKAPDRPKRRRNNIKRKKFKNIIPDFEEKKVVFESVVEPKNSEIKEESTASPHIARFKKLPPEQKRYYEEVKNYLCSYPAITNSVIKNSETFKLNKRVIARLTIKNSKLILYLKLSKDELEKHFNPNSPEYQQYEKAPMEFVFGDELELRKTLNLIESLAQEYEIDISNNYKKQPFNKLINF